jgi:protein involved in polysaccharide export with SLBB domain
MSLFYKICACLLVVAGIGCTAIIKTGDVLDIFVQSHPEFSGRYTVNETGIIDYPLVADQVIINSTTSELMNDLTIKLARHIDNPLVIVSVVQNPEIIVSVLGLVKMPGPVKTYFGASLQEVIQLAGGPLPEADMQNVKLVHKDGMNGNAEIYNLKSFLQSGNIENMPRLKPGETVIVLSQKGTHKVKIIGAVNKPGFFDYEEGLTVFDLLYLAGGPAEHADLSHIRRVFERNGKSMDEIINLQSYIDRGEMSNVPEVNEGDMVIIYSHWYDWKSALSILSNVLLLLISIQAFSGGFK